MKAEPDKNEKIAKHELKTIWQGGIVWVVLIILIVLVWSIVFLAFEFIFFGFAPPHSMNFLVSAFVATVISAILIFILLKKLKS